MKLIVILHFVCLAHLVVADKCRCHENTTLQKPVTSQPPVIGKRGLAYNDARLANDFRQLCEKCTWGYNWSWSDNGLSNETEFVPMLWGENTASQLQGNLGHLRDRGLKHILGFNEPDLAAQANMPVERAVNLHIAYLNQYAGVSRIGSPAVTSDAASAKGLDWLRKFLDLCSKRGCKVDFCAVHWYGEASQADALFTFLHQAQRACPGKPIWLTEFNVTGTNEEASSFLKQVLPTLDGLEFVQRYAWFMTATGYLFQSPGVLSAYGDDYSSL